MKKFYITHFDIQEDFIGLKNVFLIRIIYVQVADIKTRSISYNYTPTGNAEDAGTLNFLFSNVSGHAAQPISFSLPLLYLCLCHFYYLISYIVITEYQLRTVKFCKIVFKLYLKNILDSDFLPCSPSLKFGVILSPSSISPYFGLCRSLINLELF